MTTKFIPGKLYSINRSLIASTTQHRADGSENHYIPEYSPWMYIENMSVGLMHAWRCHKIIYKDKILFVWFHGNESITEFSTLKPFEAYDG